MTVAVDQNALFGAAFLSAGHAATASRTSPNPIVLRAT